MKTIKIKQIKDWLPSLNNPFVMAGPCSLENEMQALKTAKLLASDKRVFAYRGGVWKPRTRPGSFEGVGKIGLRWLQNVKKETGLLVGTEIATAEHAYEALKHDIDILWIGARSTASPFIVQEIADAVSGCDKVIMIKNPVNPDLNLWLGAIERLATAGIEKMVAIHRGFTPFTPTKFRNQPGWKTAIDLKALLPDLPIIADPSHIGGKSFLIEELSQKAFDLGMQGLMIESHYDPEIALSDKEQQVTPFELSEILNRLIKKSLNSDDLEFAVSLDQLRDRIDILDNELLEILALRKEAVKKIGRQKKHRAVAVLQINRWKEILEHRQSLALKLDLNKEYIHTLFNCIHEESIRLQSEIAKE